MKNNAEEAEQCGASSLVESSSCHDEGPHDEPPPSPRPHLGHIASSFRNSLLPPPLGGGRTVRDDGGGGKPHPLPWRLRNTIVVSATTVFYTVLLFAGVFLWLSNRQLKIGPTKRRHPNRPKSADELSREREEDEKKKLRRIRSLRRRKTREAAREAEAREAEAREAEAAAAAAAAAANGAWGRRDDDDVRDRLKRESTLRSLLNYETENDSGDDDYGSGGATTEDGVGDDVEEDDLNRTKAVTLPPPSPSLSLSPLDRQRRRQKSHDLMDVVSKMEVFSYLSSEAFVECTEYMEYVHLPRKGMSLTEGLPENDPRAGRRMGGDGAGRDRDRDDGAKDRDPKDGAGAAPSRGRGNLLDGSLYAVVSGEVTCSFDLSILRGGPSSGSGGGRNVEGADEEGAEDGGGTSLRFTAGPGDVVTSLLTMLSGLVREYQRREKGRQRREQGGEGAKDAGNQDGSAAEMDLDVAYGVRAVAAEDDTRLIRVPTRCFLVMLDRFPRDVHQISQTIISRMVRVTMQTLVKNLGLGAEILRRGGDDDGRRGRGAEPRAGSGSGSGSGLRRGAAIQSERVTMEECWEQWRRIRAELSMAESSSSSSSQSTSVPPTTDLGGMERNVLVFDEDQVKQDASEVAAAQLGVSTPEAIELIRDTSSIVSVPPGETLTRSGRVPRAGVYLLLSGELEVGIMRTQTGSAGETSSAMKEDNVHPAVHLQSHRHSSILKRNPTPPGSRSRGSAGGSPSSSFQPVYNMQPGELIGRLAGFTNDVSIVTVRNGKPESSPPDSSSSSTMTEQPPPRPAVLLAVPKATFDALLANNAGVLTRCLDYILSDFISPVVHLLDWNLEWMHVQAGEVLANRGESCDSLFVVLNGRLRVDGGEEGNNFTGGFGGNVASSSSSYARRSKSLEYGRGECIGEVEVLTGASWPSSVYAIRNSELARMPMSVLQAIIQMFPQSGLHFAKVIALQVQTKHRYGGNGGGGGDRIVSGGGAVVAASASRASSPSRGIRVVDGGSDGGAAATTTPPTSPRSLVPQPTAVLPSYGLSLATIAVVPLTSASDVDVSEFCTSLEAGMRSIAPTRLMTKAVARRHLGDEIFRHRNAMHGLKMTRLLGDLEENNRLVVYQADRKYTWWTRLCISSADCVLLLVRSDKAPENKRVEQCLAWAFESLHVRIELAVIQIPQPNSDSLLAEEGDGRDDIDEEGIHVSDQLNNWSEKRPWIAGHHLIRLPLKRHAMDVHRMCRRMTGRSVGLVLGGGGARGLAHLGVIRALREAGVSVDMVGGTSQGAFVGALYAKSPDHWATLMNNSRQMASAMSDMREKLFDLTLPLTSYFCGKRFNECIRKCLGKTTRIQDLVLNFFCISTDIGKSVQVVHTKGICWKYVRASMSLQGYLPPISENGSLLLDGGYMNVLPADVMLEQMGARTVIAVDVSNESERDYYEYGDHLSGWWLLWNSWNPFVKTVKVPSMGDLSEKLAWVSAHQHKNKMVDGIDLYLTPPIQNYGTLEFDKFDEIVEKGYEYAKPIVDEWVKQNPWLVSEQV